MIFNSKQLEELENIHDSTGAFEEEGEDDGNFEEIGEAAMDWRRGLIEEAAENIKRAKTRPVEPHLTYPIGSMLFEREARRFARVQRSVPGYLKIVYLSGGDREFGTLDVVGYLRDYGAEKRLSELSDQLGMNDADVAAELERLGITPVEEPESEEAEAATAEPELPPPPPLTGKKARAAVAVVEEDDSEEEDEEEEEAVASAEEDDLPVAGDDDDDAAPKKGAKGKATPPARAAKPGKNEKAAPPAKLQKAAKPSEKSQKSEKSEKSDKNEKAEKASKAAPPSRGDKKAAAVAANKASPPGGKINPIDDPNAFIKAHYQQQSNRELARVTGLSEHTIRRKLGEWGLKRK